MNANKSDTSFDNSQHNVFIFGGKTAVPARHFGSTSVSNAVDRSSEDFASLVGTGETDIQRKIVKQEPVVILHLIALNVSVMYVLGFDLIGLRKDVLTEIGSGISDGFNAIFVSRDSPNGSSEFPSFLYETFQAYSASLYNDLKKIRTGSYDGNFLDMGETSDLFTSNLAHQCGFSDYLEDRTIEIVPLKMFASVRGIYLLKKLIEAEIMTFVD